MKKAGMVFGMAAAAAMNVQAISYNPHIDGVNAPAGSQFVATGGNLELKTHNGWTGLGISGGAAGGEIDIGQKLTISFNSAQYIDDISLAFLYNGPEYQDGQEIAAIRINGTTEFTLTAVTDTTAAWTGSGTVQNLSTANSNSGAIWNIINPFGLTKVNSIELYPLMYPVGQSAPNLSDFSLRKFHTHSAPDAGATGALLGIGALALAAFRKKNK